MKEKIRKIKESISNTPYKKKAIIAIIVALCMVGGAAGGYSYMTHTDFGKAEVSSTELKDAEKAEDKAVSEEKKAEEELEKAKKSGDKEAIEKAEKKVEAAKEKVSSAKKEVASANKGTSHKTNASSNNNNSSTNKKPSNSGSSSNNKPSKPSSGNSGSSGSSSGGSSTSKPSKPTHQHSWKPVYGEKTEYRTEYFGDVVICNVCGEKNPSNAHKENHVMAGEGYSSHVEPEYEEVPYPVTYIKYYQCSCGATK